jgi:hypothetical protein
MRFTALPRGVVSDVPRLSVHCAFRLDPSPAPSGVLNDFPTAAAWPSTAIRWTVTFRLGTQTSSYSATLDGPDPRDTSRWQAIFRPTLSVRAYTPPSRGDRRIRTFRSARLAQRWRDQYAELAATIAADGSRPAVGLDPATGVLAGFEAAGLWSQDRAKDFDDETLLTEMDATIASQGAVPADLRPAGPARDRLDILEFRRFFRRAINDPGAPVQPPSLEFHQLTTACAAHPGLLRPLGLVVDLALSVPWGTVEKDLSGYPDEVSITGVPATTGAFAVDASPWTRCRAGATTFVARPAAGSDLTDRLALRLGDPTRFSAQVLDVETATFAATGFGSTLQMMPARRTRSTPGTEAPPALRASGIAITRLDRARRFHERVFQRGDDIALAGNPAQVSLDADDLVRGWRLDVRPEGDRWRTLVRRVGRVDLPGSRLGGWDLPEAEGWISDTLSGDDDGDLYLGEEVVRWDGWSPVAPKPGTVIGTDDQIDPDRAGSQPLPDLPVVVRYRPVPGSLVPLRYGRRYQLRVRAVDIGGNGADSSLEPDASEASPPVLFGRLDPVHSPDVLLTAPRLPGERPERVVLRSQQWDRPAAETGEVVAARHLMPPRTTVTEAEKHGVLDDAQGRPRPDLYALLAQRDAYALPDDPLAREDPDDPAAGEEGTSRYVTDLAAQDLRQLLPGPFEVGYLPDPFARALEIVDADGTSLVPLNPGISLGGDWPERTSVRLAVVEGDQVEVGWDEGERLLRVALPKATVLPLRLSCRFDDGDLQRFSLAEWLANRLGVPLSGLATTTLGRRVLAGRHWMFTPWRSLTLVHAVKQPLTEPKLDEPTFSVVARPLAVTASDLGFSAAWHAGSTGRLDLLAAWDEGVDRGPGTPAPQVRRVEVLASELRRDQAGTPADDGVVQAALRPVHEHGDTKFRRISYRLEATTAFLENFTESASVTFPAGGSADLAGVAVPSTVVLRRTVVGGDGEPTVITYRRDDGEGGDFQVVPDEDADATTLARVGDAVPTGVPLTVIYATRPISRFSPTPPVVRDVPASARPAAPVIHSVLPTFGWSTSTSGATVTSTRQPAGVRIWLQRPWWSSGLGEELAVLYLGGTSAPTAAQAPFVTTWGRDPIHAAGRARGSLTDAAFPRRAFDSVGLRPPGGPLVRAVPHRVTFDAENDMWFCDVDLALDSYWPFVRLALARWQPNAIVASDPPGSPADTTIALSPVVLADIVQLAPGRVATVTASAAGSTTTLRVGVVGPSYVTTSVDTAPPVLEATLQRQPLGTSSDVDWQVVQGPVTLTREAAPLPVGDAAVRRHRWFGSLALSTSSVSSFRYRVVLEEHERYRTDGAVSDSRRVRINGRLVTRPQPRDGRRLVYVDVVPVAPEQLG